MITNDAAAQDFRAALVQKGEGGLEVKVLMDAAGCHRLPRQFFKEPNKRRKDRPILPIAYPHEPSINNRNHPKLMIVDEDTAFIRWCNIGIGVS